ncbi:MAG: outer membrane beta-barrel protein [Chitinophagaceae bacterium]|nr:outer membrane beta-barrel protein [Chitinophagaceae bacterium]
MKSLLCLVLITVSLSLHAQDTAALKSASSFHKGGYMVTAGLGFMNSYRDEYRVPPSFEKGNITGFSPIFVRGEYAVSNRVSLGATFNYSMLYFNSFRLYPSFNGPVKRYTADQFRVFGVGLSAWYHFDKLLNVRGLDPFIGIGANINNERHTALPEGDSTARFRTHTVTPLIKAGVRYYLSDKVSVYGDAGFDKFSIVSLGVTCRFDRRAR